jgi:beta-lactamase class A
MKIFFSFLALLFLVLHVSSTAQNLDSLRLKIQRIVSPKSAEVGIAIMSDNGKDTLSINGDKHLPMQSVFKFHIALALLSEIDKGKFSLQQKVTIKQNELLPDLYSPIREKYPQGVTLTLAEITEYTVSQSDNVGCDVLLRLLGGPSAVEKYFLSNKFKDVSIKINEETMQRNWDQMFLNWTTPKTANQVLSEFYRNDKKFLSKKSYEFIWNVMKATQTGKARLKGLLPEGTVVAHKTGYSGTNKQGIMAAVNDIGIVFLPNGRHFYISVFVTNSRENLDTNEKIIAEIAKVAWEHFVGAAK